MITSLNYVILLILMNSYLTSKTVFKTYYELFDNHKEKTQQKRF